MGFTVDNGKRKFIKKVSQKFGNEEGWPAYGCIFESSGKVLRILIPEPVCDFAYAEFCLPQHFLGNDKAFRLDIFFGRLACFLP